MEIKLKKGLLNSKVKGIAKNTDLTFDRIRKFSSKINNTSVIDNEFSSGDQLKEIRRIELARDKAIAEFQRRRQLL